MAKHPRWKYRNADEGRIALRGIADEFPERQFGNVPLAAFQKSEGDFFDRQRESRQHDAVEEITFRFLKSREWDVSELSFGKFIGYASQGNAPFVGIPVFPSRVFRHSAIY